jgi:hypothetical protein
MHSRLLSFLSDFERALLADDPAPDEGSWQNERAVNYRTGLARVQLGVKMPDGLRKIRGGVMLQGFKLADGAACLKAQLSWTGSEGTINKSIFAKPGCDWKTEARRVAATWMAGPPVAALPPGIEAEAVAVGADVHEEAAVAAM